MIHNKKFGFVGTTAEARSSNDPLVQNFIHVEMETGDK
jgi:ABC-type transporter Mla maintaining outer membrane lipid asymmetry ATPase subunit MlaF